MYIYVAIYISVLKQCICYFLQAESLLELFPSSDKSLSRLLCEVPYLPKSVLKLLENLCCPKSNENIKKDFQGGDRVTQGLIAVWSLILHRPPNRETCLKIVLQVIFFWTFSLTSNILLSSSCLSLLPTTLIHTHRFCLLCMCMLACKAALSYVSIVRSYKLDCTRLYVDCLLQSWYRRRPTSREDRGRLKMIVRFSSMEQ